ncbi:hypothetical protein LR48_Vigan11g141700 [Vigna angularis]|nr:hypothetical protein LR48_Vigan11g141700 [Vigna angularis]
MQEDLQHPRTASSLGRTSPSSNPHPEAMPNSCNTAHVHSPDSSKGKLQAPAISTLQHLEKLTVEGRDTSREDVHGNG